MPVTTGDAQAVRDALDRRGHGIADWAAQPLAAATQVLALGPSASRAGLPAAWTTVGPLIAEAPTVCGAFDALPVGTNAVDGVCLFLLLAAVTSVDDLFAEVRRVLRPAGTLVVITPSASPRRPSERSLRAVHRSGWSHHSALDGAGWLLAAADFAVIADDRVGFTVPVPDGLAAAGLATDLPAAGLWPPVPASESVRARVMSVAGPRGRWPVPVRRLIARR